MSALEVQKESRCSEAPRGFRNSPKRLTNREKNRIERKGRGVKNGRLAERGRETRDPEVKGQGLPSAPATRADGPRPVTRQHRPSCASCPRRVLRPGLGPQAWSPDDSHLAAALLLFRRAPLCEPALAPALLQLLWRTAGLLRGLPPGPVL